MWVRRTHLLHLHSQVLQSNVLSWTSASYVNHQMCTHALCAFRREISMLDQYFAGHVKNEYIVSLSQVIQTLRAGLLPNGND